MAIRLASRDAIEQSEAVASPNAKAGVAGLRLPGIVSSASALAMQVHPPPEGREGFGTDLSAAPMDAAE
jgi:hypothetical protein